MEEKIFNDVVLNKGEKLCGLFSHFSIFFGGLIVPLIFWVVNREKSKFVSFHSLQALFFHIGYFLYIFIQVFMFLILGFYENYIKFQIHDLTNAGIATISLMFAGFYAICLLITLSFWSYSIYMGLQSYKGKIKKYPIIGNIIFKKVFD